MFRVIQGGPQASNAKPPVFQGWLDIQTEAALQIAVMRHRLQRAACLGVVKLHFADAADDNYQLTVSPNGWMKEEWIADDGPVYRKLLHADVFEGTPVRLMDWESVFYAVKGLTDYAKTKPVVAMLDGQRQPVHINQCRVMRGGHLMMHYTAPDGSAAQGVVYIPHPASTVVDAPWITPGYPAPMPTGDLAPYAVDGHVLIDARDGLWSVAPIRSRVSRQNSPA
jgi:hypothetical protein